MLGWLDKGCDLEKRPGSVWHLLHAAQCLATAELINCLLVLGYVCVWGGRGFKMWKEWEEGGQRWRIKGIK